MRSKWYEMSMSLVEKHKLGFLHNPGGGQFVKQGVNIQVGCMDDREDYFTLLRCLKELGLEKQQ